MRMFRRDENSGMPGLNTAALPDLIFTVLFFFMFVTHMRYVDTEVRVTTPAGQNLEKVTTRSSVISLFITADGKVHVDGKIINVDDVADYISAERRKMQPEDVRKLMVNIKADKAVRMGVMNSIRQQLRNINVLNVNYSATDKKDKNLQTN